jgi:hypothetical protein
MTSNTLKEQALAETARFFQKSGATPAEDSEEWEDEYRRQFERLKTEAAKQTAPATSRPAPEERPVDIDMPELVGTPAEKRWAFALRSERLKQIQTKDLRAWLSRAWTRSKEWIDTRELSSDAFLRRVEPQYVAARRQSTAQMAVVEAARTTQAKTAAALQTQIAAAGISAAGLLGLIDVSPRVPAISIKEKLAELHLEGRTVRIFETADPAILMVLEKREEQRSEYGIERDEGLVADLKLFARTML